MKISEVTESPIREFSNEMVDAHSGQQDFRLTVSVGGKTKGSVTYSLFQDEVSINMIEVNEKSQGHGKALMKHLQGLNPDKEIEWGVTTDEGEALRKSLKYKLVKTEHYDDFVEFEKVQRTLDDLQAKADAFHEIENPSDDQKQAFFKMIEPMNDLHERHADLEELLWDKKKYHRIIVG